MITVLLDNSDNDKTLKVNLPIVPRIGDWIRLDYEDEFTGGETILIVKNVILEIESESITVVVTSNS